MKIAVLGGSGRTGKLVLRKAIQSGIPVKALIRNKQIMEESSDLLTLVEGSPLDKSLLKETLTGCDAVISTLGVSRRSDFPWAKLKAPPDLVSATARHIIDIASEMPERPHVIITTAWGVSETRKDIPFWFRFLIDSSNIGAAYKDHERQEELFINSGIDWTIVRPVGLTNGKPKENIKVSLDNKPRPSMTISRESVADFLIRTALNKSHIHQKPVISE